jgi:hypothetical protein
MFRTEEVIIYFNIKFHYSPDRTNALKGYLGIKSLPVRILFSKVWSTKCEYLVTQNGMCSYMCISKRINRWF